MPKHRVVAGAAIALVLFSIAAGGCSGGSSAATLAPSDTGPKTSRAAGLPTTTAAAASLTPDTGPGGTWIQQDVAGDKPTPRVYPSLAYAPNVDRMFLFGGFLLDSSGDLSDFSDELWAYAPGTAIWERVQPNNSGPDARQRAAVGYDEKTGQLILFGGTGGFDVTDLNDTWAYDPRANSWTELHPTSNPPGGAHRDTTMVYDPQSDRMLLVVAGGQDSNELELWSLDVATSVWSKLESAGPVPPARIAPSIVYAPDLNQIVMIAGTNQNGRALDDNWFFDPASRRWSQKAAPSRSSFVGEISFGSAQAAAYDAAGHQVIFCTTQRSGSPASYAFKTLAYSPSKDQWTVLETAGTAPPPLLHVATVTYDSSRNAFMFYGGVTGTDHYTFNDGLWIYIPPRSS